MSSLTRIENVAQTLIDRLPAFLHGEKTLAVLTSLGNIMQGWEDLYDDLRGISVQDSSDYLLEVIASWRNLERDGDTDQDLRARVLAQIILDTTGGQREAVLQFLSIIRGQNIKYWQLASPTLGYGWGQVNYQMSDSPVITEDQSAQILDLMADPGAYMVSSYSVKPFGFAGNPNAYGFGAGTLGIAGDFNNGGINI